MAPVEREAPDADESRYGITGLDAENGGERWRLDTGMRAPVRLTTADGLLFYYLLDEDSVSNEGIRATVVDTQSTKWRYGADFEAQSGPVVDSADVFVGGSTGRVHSLTARSGRRNWTERVGSDGTVALADGPGHVVVGSVNGTVSALEKETGAVVWTHSEPVGGFPGAAVADGTAYVVYLDGTVASYDLGSGDTHWTVSTGASAFGRPPAVTQNRVLLGSRGANESGRIAVQALDRATGADEWRREFDDTVYPPRATDDIAVTATLTTNSPPTIAAFAPRSGELKWTYTPRSRSDQYQYAYESPQIAEGAVYAGTVDGRVFALER